MKLLDTNTVIAILNDNPETELRFRAALARRQPIAVSAVVIFELRYGIAKSTLRKANAVRLDTFLSAIVAVLPFDDEDARHAGEVRATLARTGRPIGPYDVMIAGQALRHGAAVVTANTSEFGRVAGLKIEDWTKPR